MKEIKDIDELKEIELRIMKKVHSFCVDNQIKYGLFYGTLIGTIRHKGFIPWDDDIDIVMTRPEYEKFIALFPKHAANLGLELVNNDTPIHYARLLSKVIDTSTVLYEPEYRTDDPIGVFIDVWPVDGLPNNVLHKKLYNSFTIILKKLLLATSMKTSQTYGIFKNIVITISHIFSPNIVLNALESLAKKYSFDNSHEVKCYMAYPCIYAREDFEEFVLSDFEGEQFFIPRNYDEMLRKTYGDYMKLPPEEKRVPHHVMNTFYK